MDNNAQDRLDALAGGCRGWFYLMLSFSLGVFYFSLLITGFAIGLGLSIIWIGLPLLMLMFAFSRQLAAFDRHLAAFMLNTRVQPLTDDLTVTGWNPFTRLGAYMTSASTWQRLIYLFLKLPLGIVGFHLALLILPLLTLETLLALLGIHFGLITPRITHALATGLSGTMLLSTEKPKRDRVDDVVRARKRLEVDEDELYISDDGEIVARRPKRKRGSVHD
jgi:hypothetical protein